jgi:hypothetical protein
MISQAESDSRDRGLSAPQAEEIASPLTQVDPQKRLLTRQVRSFRQTCARMFLSQAYYLLEVLPFQS